MQRTRVGTDKRRQDRTKVVFPVKVRGKDASGESFDEMAHTLDITSTGARLGSIRRELQILDQVTVWYHQRKMEFRVVWIKKLERSSEYHIGLQAMDEEREAWGLNASDFRTHKGESMGLPSTLATALREAEV